MLFDNSTASRGGISRRRPAVAQRLARTLPPPLLKLTPQRQLLFRGTSETAVFSPSDLGPVPLAWNSLNTTLGTTQFYPGLSIHPADSSIAYAGSQDNGVQEYTGNTIWQVAGCGDGGRTAIDFNTPSTVYFHCAGDRVYKISADNPYPTDAGIGNQEERTQGLAPLTMDPNDSQRLYFGSYRVWVSNDAAICWAPISPGLTVPGRIIGLNVISVAPPDSNTVYAAAGDNDISRVWVSTNALAGPQSSWTDVTGSLPQRPPTQIAVDRANPGIAYIAFSGFAGFNGDSQGHVFKTSDFGASWTDVSANLPNLPVNDLLVDPDVPATVYAATDHGVYWTINGGAVWSLLGIGLPNTSVVSLAMYRPARLLRAATWGRGAWDLNMPKPNPRRPRRGALEIELGAK